MKLTDIIDKKRSIAISLDIKIAEYKAAMELYEEIKNMIEKDCKGCSKGFVKEDWDSDLVQQIVADMSKEYDLHFRVEHKNSYLIVHITL